jgi:hypothetical protein
MSDTVALDGFEKHVYRGHDIFPGANKMLGSNPLPCYFYAVTLQYQQRPGVVGYSFSTGLIVPKEGSQTGEWTLALLNFLGESLPTYNPNAGRNGPAAGTPIMINTWLNETYRENPNGPSDHLVDETPGSWDNED